ncbi:MAG: transcription-repair coupling factor [Chloroflexota bacterium]
MNLSGLLLLADRMPGFRALVTRVGAGQDPARARLSQAAKPYLLGSLGAVLGRPLLVLTAEPRQARRLYDDLLSWTGQAERLSLFPGYHGLFYERAVADPGTSQQRLQVLAALAGESDVEQPVLVIADARSVMQRLAPPEALLRRRFTIRRGEVLRPDHFAARLLALGFEPVTTVIEVGSFARRGGIVDVFSPSLDQPLRVEFFGDEVESLRLFDPMTQRSQTQLDDALVSPPRELTPEVAASLANVLASADLSRVSPEVAERWQEDRDALQRGALSPLLEPYLAYAGTASLLDFCGPRVVVVVDELEQLAASVEALVEQAESLRVELQDQGQLPGSLPRPYFSWGELAASLDQRTRCELQSDEDEDGPDVLALPFKPVGGYGGKIKQALADSRAWAQTGDRVLITSQQADRLGELLAEVDVHAAPVEAIAAPPPAGSITVARGTVLQGWRCRPLALTVISDAELFGWAKPRPAARRRVAAPVSLLSELSEGDYVVHVDHGVGRYQGIQRLQPDGNARDYLVLEYASGDRMFVPVEQADRVGKYHGAGEDAPVLHRLGTAEWTRAKERVKNAARDIAKELLEIYSAREVLPGYAFGPDTPWQAEMEGSFPYIETADQLQAVNEVKRDMESARPMDRLISGDVGYGKTEVALRAAFKAVNEGRQVAVLVPTTILAQQHYSTYKERLEAFPMTVEVLSRFRTPKEQKSVLAGLGAGTVDIVIGTHRLLQKDVAFKDLGLLVIDEEHRFGVTHKEKLKRLRREVDVLTLSATPIPRTMHMSLVGVRDMSTIATPPEERLPIKTHLGPYKDSVVRDAILRELDRGGQVFFVHHRVQGIEEVARRLERLVPEARVQVAHGQMQEGALENVMLAFAAGEFEVLVCTTIIESGLDIPNANTIIINNADRFGLAQLYQLRGRVGRSTNRAYAYLLHNRVGRLSPVAEQRLRTIFEATDLGAGFQVALRDLEIRGAGNLLGAEQHGHIATVGFDLYCRLLGDAVEELRGEATTVPRVPQVSIDLPLTAYLAPDYIADESTRLNLYQRLAAVRTEEEAGALTLEIQDRFGPPPKEVLNLLYLVQLKAIAARAGIQSIGAEDGHLVLRLGPAAQPNRPALLKRHGRYLQMSPNQLRLDRRRLGEGWQAELQAVVVETAQASARS